MPDDQTAPGTPPGGWRRGAGELEAEVLAVLWQAGAPLSPGQVRERLPTRGQPEPAYSTVVTTLARMHAKGVLSRERAGHAHRYQPVADEAGLAARRMRQVLEDGADRDLVLTRFVSGLPAGDEQLLRRLFGGGPPAASPGDGPGGEG